MRITDLLKKQGISLGISAKDKRDAINKLVSLHEKCGNLKDVSAYRDGILAREEMGTTAIGMEVAIPHAKSEAVRAPALTAITVPNGVDYGSPDGAPCKLIFMIAATTDGDVHLEVLARLMQMLMHEDFTAKLKAAKTPDEFLKIIDDQETKQFPEEAAAPAAKKDGYRVLAVTACPTGIAHTYMAAEALAKAGDKLGITIKVETNGSGGAKNVLTAEEIANCDGIIIAADKNVETARFDGKPVLTTKVADGIHKPEELINKIVNGEVGIFHSDKKASASAASADDESFGRKLYKHLMNGVSHMLPFVVAGGIFIAIAFLIDSFAGVPQDSGFGSGTPVSLWFMKIGNAAFGFMLPILAGFIAMSIADRPGLLVGIVGGALAASGATFANPAALTGEEAAKAGVAAAIPSGFLGALLAGFVAGWLLKMFEKLCEKLPQALEGIKPILLYPLVGLGIVGVMMCAVNPFMGIINDGLKNGINAMASQPALLIPVCALLAGMMAIDMGGPFNKAAYVTATALLTEALKSQNPDDPAFKIMAAVMIGGMVPPIAIALSTTIFRNRWSNEERKSGPVNYIMGLSFVTEGAIPYAAGHPLQVIPSCLVGSACAGALSALFGCTLKAPHGGIFVLPTIGNPFMYFLALIIGAVVGMLMLAVLKKPIKE